MTLRDQRDGEGGVGDPSGEEPPPGVSRRPHAGASLGTALSLTREARELVVQLRFELARAGLLLEHS